MTMTESKERYDEVKGVDETSPVEHVQSRQQLRRGDRHSNKITLGSVSAEVETEA